MSPRRRARTPRAPSRAGGRQLRRQRAPHPLRRPACRARLDAPGECRPARRVCQRAAIDRRHAGCPAPRCRARRRTRSSVSEIAEAAPGALRRRRADDEVGGQGDDGREAEREDEHADQQSHGDRRCRRAASSTAKPTAASSKPAGDHVAGRQRAREQRRQPSSRATNATHRRQRSRARLERRQAEHQLQVLGDEQERRRTPRRVPSMLVASDGAERRRRGTAAGRSAGRPAALRGARRATPTATPAAIDTTRQPAPARPRRCCLRP